MYIPKKKRAASSHVPSKHTEIILTFHKSHGRKAQMVCFQYQIVHFSFSFSAYLHFFFLDTKKKLFNKNMHCWFGCHHNRYDSFVQIAQRTTKCWWMWIGFVLFLSFLKIQRRKKTIFFKQQQHKREKKMGPKTERIPIYYNRNKHDALDTHLIYI